VLFVDEKIYTFGAISTDHLSTETAARAEADRPSPVATIATVVVPPERQQEPPLRGRLE